jgi:hypothetical protein
MKRTKAPQIPAVLVIAIIAFVLLGGYDIYSRLVDDCNRSKAQWIEQGKAEQIIEEKKIMSSRIEYMARVFMHWNKSLYWRKAVEYSGIIYNECLVQGVPFEFIVAQIIKESTVREYARGSSGEIGLLQIMPFWLESQEELGFTGITKRELFDPENNIRMGIRILKRCLERSGGDVFKALCYYNAGFKNDGKAGVQYAKKVLSLAEEM